MNNEYERLMGLRDSCVAFYRKLNGAEVGLRQFYWNAAHEFEKRALESQIASTAY